MNEIAFSLGSFFGGLVFGILSWKVGDYIALAVTQRPRLAAFIGAMLSVWYAETRDSAAGRWGAVLAIVLMLLSHWATDSKPPA